MAEQRPYYTDSYTTTFEAELIEQTSYEETPAVVLNHSYFYPASGGQPHDTGTLNGIPVTNVVIRESDQAVLHVLADDVDLAAAFSSAAVQGVVNWARRFDHMQHHTGQHILSQAFIQVADAETIGFHLSGDSVTIDLDKAQIAPELVDAAEDLANQIVIENRPVTVLYPTEEEVKALLLRKVPDVVGKLRVVDIGGFDVTACGGTHVAWTGEIGLIKVLRIERRADTVRVEFRCGTRALHDYRAKHAIASQLSAELTTGVEHLPDIVAKMRDENRAQSRELRVLKKTVFDYEAEALWQNADRAHGYALITQIVEDRDVKEARQLIQNLIAREKTIVLCGLPGDKALLITARSDDLPHDMVPVLMDGLAVLGVDRGGGRPTFAQGGGVKASRDQIEMALAAAAITVRTSH